MNLKYALSLISILLAVFLISGCLGGSAAKDCGDDMICFVEAAQTCTPAKLTVLESGSLVYMEIKGGTTDACTVYYDYDMDTVGKMDMTCTTPTTQIAISSPDALCDYCSGSLRDYYCEQS